MILDFFGHLVEAGSGVGSCPEAGSNSGLWAFKQRCCSVICEKTSLCPPHRITGWRGSGGERCPLLPLEMRPDYEGESGMQPWIPVAPGEKNSVLDTNLDELYFALQ